MFPMRTVIVPSTIKWSSYSSCLKETVRNIYPITCCVSTFSLATPIQSSWIHPPILLHRHSTASGSSSIPANKQQSHCSSSSLIFFLQPSQLYLPHPSTALTLDCSLNLTEAIFLAHSALLLGILPIIFVQWGYIISHSSAQWPFLFYLSTPVTSTLLPQNSVSYDNLWVTEPQTPLNCQYWGQLKCLISLNSRLPGKAIKLHVTAAPYWTPAEILYTADFVQILVERLGIEYGMPAPTGSCFKCLVPAGFGAILRYSRNIWGSLAGWSRSLGEDP